MLLSDAGRSCLPPHRCAVSENAGNAFRVTPSIRKCYTIWLRAACQAAAEVSK